MNEIEYLINEYYSINFIPGLNEKSKEILRKRGLAYAEKRADKLATQGLIGLHSDDKSVTMV